MTENEPGRFNQILDYIWAKRIAFLAGALMFVGVVLAFFFMHVGGILVGLAVGMCFFDEIYSYVMQLRTSYAQLGLFKTVMWIAMILFFLITLPTFIISVVVGFCAILLFNYLIKKKDK